MDFITITNDEKIAQLVTSIYHREQEIHNYQANIQNYTALYSVLPKEWPQDLVQFKNLGEDLAIVPFDKLQQVSDLKFGERIGALLRTESIEQNKAKHIYNALISQLPAGFDLSAALLAEKEKVKAAEAAVK
jgi:hypothetical protein